MIYKGWLVGWLCLWHINPCKLSKVGWLVSWLGLKAYQPL